MRSALILNDLWQYIDGTAFEPTTNTKVWMKNDSKASVVLNMSTTSGKLYHIKWATKQAWVTLKDIYVSRGPVKQY